MWHLVTVAACVREGVVEQILRGEQVCMRAARVGEGGVVTIVACVRLYEGGEPRGAEWERNLRGVGGHAGFTGADLQNLMNEAAILAARRGLKEISKEEISDALERIIAGPEKKGAVMTEAKKKLVAYHEVRFPCPPSHTLLPTSGASRPALCDSRTLLSGYMCM